MHTPFQLHDVDVELFTQELMALRRAANERLGDKDFKHLKKIERWGRLCTAAGYGTAWIIPNPVSALLISLGNVNRWTNIAHPVLHRGYDKIPGIPARYTSKGFAKGFRRWLDWADWMDPAAWDHEHNRLHHYNLGEAADPDQVELNLEWLRDSKLPMPLRYAVVGLFAVSWKPFYYAPNTLKSMGLARTLAPGEVRQPGTLAQLKYWNPLTPEARELWTRCFLPYLTLRFGAIPLLFTLSPLGPIGAVNVWLNTLLAEIFTNIHSFIVIAPNHTGDDLILFESQANSKSEFYLRQITGSANFRTGGDLNDFLHGWLNYQIEHHIWPDLPMSEYQRLQPQVKALCEKYGIPYVQESVWKRLKKTVDVMVGKASMPRQASVSGNRRASVDSSGAKGAATTL
ncbi:fatty acid desaturase [Fluviicoccus keumensis]|uniref:Fatty acid desaturase n=1 Tax=Fluviicoccus keumensis TaxID=1435465 RepID=A0A4V2G3S5_9GAMM|nr:fatty acid desaturase [Fluviicoccus keumensis]RZU38196.1 fatty acid desaturase [Fluviicoccus keumensis]